MAADADSAVARIAHRKLAALHALSADRAVEAAVWRARGESPIAQPTVL
ncbi:hypothetical protein [Sphingomonas japonica]|uniref:Uncharacterized protein n=1 Tax=Sphingomonas japonica TaxID=511662 RepID=A0ABX0TZV8_9SPHN|nr:hypothetical protein [Sphingomonas japonica]NIJ23773.1 hypothetical protein [Sphingomonas japonica]